MDELSIINLAESYPRDFAIFVFIIDEDGNVLFVKNTSKPRHASFWALPAAQRRHHKTPLGALRNRIYAETGLRLRPENVEMIFRDERTVRGKPHDRLLLVARVGRLLGIPPPDDLIRSRAIAVNDITKDFIATEVLPTHHELIREALKHVRR